MRITEGWIGTRHPCERRGEDSPPYRHLLQFLTGYRKVVLRPPLANWLTVEFLFGENLRSLVLCKLRLKFSPLAAGFLPQYRFSPTFCRAGLGQAWAYSPLLQLAADSWACAVRPGACSSRVQLALQHS